MRLGNKKQKNFVLRFVLRSSLLIFVFGVFFIIGL